MRRAFDLEENRMSERRRTPRTKSLLRGRILFNNRQSGIDCLIRDYSEQGARLIFSDNVGIPGVVDLHIPQKDQTLRAHIQWRHSDEVGVTFSQATDAPSATGASRDLTERVEQLEAEVALLKRMLKRLKAEVAAGTEAA
jgi:hypothetical protein